MHRPIETIAGRADYRAFGTALQGSFSRSAGEKLGFSSCVPVPSPHRNPALAASVVESPRTKHPF